MKKILILIGISVALFSCKKDKDVTSKDFQVTLSVKIYNRTTKTYFNADSCKVVLYEYKGDALPVFTGYTSDGTITATLKGDRDYLFNVTSASYPGYHYYKTNTIHSTRENGNKVVANDPWIVFLKDNLSDKQDGKGSTYLTFPDPAQ